VERAGGLAVPLSTKSLFLLSTSGSESSLRRHNAALQQLGVAIVYYTFPHKIGAQDYAQFLRLPMVRGGAVTGQGLKTDILPFLDHVEAHAAEMKAVNTVVNRGGKLFGYNTDAYGFETAVRKHFAACAVKINTAVIYGNGGVSGIAFTVLKNLGLKVTMTGRNLARVGEKMKQFGITEFAGPYGLVVNAAPVSSTPLEEASGFLNALQQCKMVFDHNMPEKDGKPNYLSEYCVHNNVHYIPGKEMYAPQMVKQWLLFFDGLVDEHGKPWLSEDKFAKLWEL